MVYPDGETIEIYDHVDVRFPGRYYHDFVTGKTVHAEFRGQIEELYQDENAALVLYEDEWLTDRRGQPTRRLATVPISHIDLFRRDG